MNTAKQTSRVAFTILEMLVAIAAVALIGVGLARLFGSTGDTVRIGRRVSAMNDYAGLIQRTIRSDLETLSRDGFMLIRNREVRTPGGTGILLSPNDPNRAPRARRVDEWMFFTQGKFTSLREPIHPAKYPQGYSARIYFGHGLQRGDDRNGIEPQLGDDNTNNVPSFGEDGPNQFASQWILLRHQAVLAPPNVSDLRPPTSVTLSSSGSTLAAAWPDTPIQVGLLPAASGLFRNEAISQADIDDLRTKFQAPITTTPWLRGDIGPTRSLVASGLVDVIATDLSQIRQRVLSTNRDPKNGSQMSSGQMIRPLSFGVEASTNPPSPTFVIDQNPTDLNGTTSRMKLWMMYALPGGKTSGAPDDAADGANQDIERRMRCELIPPNYLGTSSPGANGTQFNPTDAAFKRADQLMLSSSNFIPGCTEFIVEWSFGERFEDNDPRAGQIIWHGLPRYLDLDNDGTPDTTDPLARQADVYLNQASSSGIFPADRNGTWVIGTPGTNPPSPSRLYLVDTLSEVIHYPPNAKSLASNWPQGRALYSCFGYVDPTYDQNPAGNSPIPGSASNVDESSPKTIPWPWPKFVRITLSLVDPADPENEQTYQFVFPVPERRSEGL